MTDSTSIALPLFTKFGRFATTFRLEFTTTKEQSRILFYHTSSYSYVVIAY